MEIKVQIFVGDRDTNNYLDNPACKGELVNYGGWLDCGLTGRYLALTSIGRVSFEFIEVMAYSQYYIHHNAMSSVLSSTLILRKYPNDCFAHFVLRSTIVTLPTSTVDGYICSEEETTPTLTVTMKADVMIECVLLTPLDDDEFAVN